MIPLMEYGNNSLYLSIKRIWLYLGYVYFKRIRIRKLIEKETLLIE